MAQYYPKTRHNNLYYSKTRQVRHLLSHKDSKDQDSGNDLAGYPGLESCMWLQSSCWPGLQSYEGLKGDRKIYFKDGLLTWMLARELSSLPYASLHSTARVPLITWQLASHRVSDLRKREQGGSQSAFYGPVCEVTHIHFHFYS